MYCNRCGRTVADHSLYCNYCGARLDGTRNQTGPEDQSSFPFALLGFFLPLIGLILFLICEGKKPRRAKSAGKGALIGFVTRIVVGVILFAAYLFFTASLFGNVTNSMEELMPTTGSAATDDAFIGESPEAILDLFDDIMTEIQPEKPPEDCAEVTFGDFTITDNGYYHDTALAVTVKNTAEKRYTFFITIEAVDENGARLATDMVYADRLNPGQEIHLTAFSYVDPGQIEQYQTATFKILQIDAYE